MGDIVIEEGGGGITFSIIYNLFIYLS